MEGVESKTVPVDSNNNGGACSTETMCSGGVLFLFSSLQFAILFPNVLTMTNAACSFITDAGNNLLLRATLRSQDKGIGEQTQAV